MKEKLTATITLGFIFSLFFYYKIINPIVDNSTLSDNVNVESIVEFSQDIVEEKDNKLEINPPVSDKTNDNNIDNDNCNLNNEQTDKLEFANAFKYYRNCNGSSGSFTWNSNIYSTLLKSELDNNMLLVNKKDETDDAQVVDTKHLQLQNQLIYNKDIK